jgi:ATP-dependent DNA ligase
MLISKGKAPQLPELRGKLETLRYPAYVEPKIDGEPNWFVNDKGTCHLINKSGKIRLSCPITEELRHIEHRLLGELCWGDGKAGSLYELLKHQTDDRLKFMVFDVDLPRSYIQRHRWLQQHVNTTNHVNVIQNYLAYTKVNVMYFYNYLVNNGYEGAVVKSHDSRLIVGPCPWIKIKKKETLDLKVVQISTTQERIEVLCGEKRVGAKCLDKYKKNLKVGDIVEIEHQGVLDGGGLRHPVFIRKRDDKCAT